MYNFKLKIVIADLLRGNTIRKKNPVHPKGARLKDTMNTDLIPAKKMHIL